MTPSHSQSAGQVEPEVEAVDDPDRLQLPGFDEPLTSENDVEDCFLHALWRSNRFLSVGLKLREIRMLEFMNQITDKAEWERKVFDETIVKKWHDEAMGPQAQARDYNGDVYMSEKMFSNCIKELRDKARDYEDTRLISIFDAEIEVVKSDVVIPKSLADLLKSCVKPLEDVPDDQRDWHPGSDQKVLDLVHPSLFPMVYGKTRVLPYGEIPLHGCAKFCGMGETYTLPGGPNKPGSGGRPYLQGNTQWLPSDIAWTSAGGTQITSYINNLHPDDHPELYGVLEQFVSAAVPLWERCLYAAPQGDSIRKPRISKRPLGEEEEYYIPEGIVYEAEGVSQDNLDDYKSTREYEDWEQDHRVLKWPEPDDYDPSRACSADQRPDLRAEFPYRLQVIFKLANIHLSPTSPEYAGGSLHVEGALNDHIVATALYYYDSDNITDTLLELHQLVDVEEVRDFAHPEQSEATANWLGFERDDEPLQLLGKVVTREGRFIAFPNVLAHEVQPFKLVDCTRPGHRKILAMFLVDPGICVLSTSVVPPQRRDWWAREIRTIGPLRDLTNEIFNMIIELIDGFPTMSWEDAVATREVLMEERSWVRDQFNDDLDDEVFNYCEH